MLSSFSPVVVLLPSAKFAVLGIAAAYLDELEWRFNNRDNPYLFRDTLKRLLLSNRLENTTN